VEAFDLDERRQNSKEREKQLQSKRQRPLDGERATGPFYL